MKTKKENWKTKYCFCIISLIVISIIAEITNGYSRRIVSQYTGNEVYPLGYLSAVVFSVGILLFSIIFLNEVHKIPSSRMGRIN